MTVTYTDYNNDLTNFAAKHNKKAECKIETSPMIDNRYHKEYMWSDGANWFENTELITEAVEVEAHGIKTTANISFWRTEYWSTECGSKYFYEKA